MTFPTEAEAHEFIALIGMGEDARRVVIPTTHGYWVITSAREAAMPAKACSICQQPYHEFPNNAQPVNDGQCCAYCDDHVVTPARITLAERGGL